jgi:DNA-binding NtrC family response regulator
LFGFTILTRSIGSVFSSSTEPARYWRVQNNRIHVAGAFEMTQLSCPLTGLRFLIIEDEMSQALLLAEILNDMGGSISEMAFGIEQARELVRKDSFDCALLDVNLNGTLSFPIAETMRMRGTPFVFCTGYAAGMDVYPEATRIPVVDKPVQTEELCDAVLTALSH